MVWAHQSRFLNQLLLVLCAAFVAAVATSCSQAAVPGAPLTSKRQNSAAVPTVVAEFPIPTASSFPQGITAGPDGNLWFTENRKIGRITTAGSFAEFSITGGAVAITAGPDGNLWFTEDFPCNCIGRITPRGALQEFPLPAGGSIESSDAGGIAAGSDGNVWFTDGGSGKIGRITTKGVICEFAPPSPPCCPPLERAITAGPDGNVWFAGQSTPIGKITPAGIITEFPDVFRTTVLGITTGPDGNLWFTDLELNQIGKVATTGASLGAFPIPPCSTCPNPGGITINGAQSIAAGPDGNLWFTETIANRIGRITTAGSIGELSLALRHNPLGIAAGPDGNLWFTEFAANKIGKLVP